MNDKKVGGWSLWTKDQRLTKRLVTSRRTSVLFLGVQKRWLKTWPEPIFFTGYKVVTSPNSLSLEYVVCLECLPDKRLLFNECSRFNTQLFRNLYGFKTIGTRVMFTFTTVLTLTPWHWLRRCETCQKHGGFHTDFKARPGSLIYVWQDLCPFRWPLIWICK